MTKANKILIGLQVWHLVYVDFIIFCRNQGNYTSDDDEYPLRNIMVNFVEIKVT